jgi:hypothetical protein
MRPGRGCLHETGIRKSQKFQLRLETGLSYFRPGLMHVNIYYKLEIHACNNPSPVFKRCILSAVVSTSSQGVCEVR